MAQVSVVEAELTQRVRFVHRLWETYEAVDRASLLLKVGVSALAITLQVLGLAHFEPDTRGLNIWRLFAQTAPLTLAFMLAISVLFEAMRAPRDFGMAILGPTVILFIATLIAVRIGHLEIFDQPPSITVPVPLVGGLIYLLSAFYSAYGAERFWSSLVLALVLLVTFRALGDVWKPG